MHTVSNGRVVYNEGGVEISVEEREVLDIAASNYLTCFSVESVLSNLAWINVVKNLISVLFN